LGEILENLVDTSHLKNLYRIQSSAKLMNQLLTDLLTLSRAEAGKLEYKLELLDVQSLCLNLVEDINFFSLKTHTLKFISQGSCVRVNLDEKLLYSILSNLLLNAIKYSPQGGDIYLILSCEPEATVFLVKDKGIGIHPDEQRQIYEPFYRGQNVDNITGTGLGLAVVKKCLELHQGEIRVESEVGVGTTFTVRIPHQKV
jgi:signal transduction histidine kinase